jgi:hypothetical protein
VELIDNTDEFLVLSIQDIDPHCIGVYPDEGRRLLLLLCTHEVDLW